MVLKLTAFLLTFAVATSVAAQTNSDELLSYICARNVSTIVERGQQVGPVFSEGPLVFTSTEVQGGGKFLILSAGSGTYTLALPNAGVNRLRFQLPTQSSPKPKIFYLSYVHDGVFRSRYFDFSADKPPIGRDELDYDLASVRKADYMLPNLEYAIYETSENTLTAITDGRVKRDQMNKHKMENCEHISRKTPGLARNLKHNLDVLEMIVIGPKEGRPRAASRLPASVIPSR
ncbi:MAG: hypothetical protein KF799_00915 [Bdellovibrionales bacterium]|nr:hypothetical protein [Bdellovibrionales bacterium]